MPAAAAIQSFPVHLQDSQRHRGGGSLCFQQPALWESFRESIQQLESCPLPSDWLRNKKMMKQGLGKKSKRKRLLPKRDQDGVDERVVGGVDMIG